jgi:hypothetical protein
MNPEGVKGSSFIPKSPVFPVRSFANVCLKFFVFQIFLPTFAPRFPRVKQTSFFIKIPAS